MFKDRTGEVYTFKDGRTMEIIKYHNTDDIIVMFNDMTIICNQRYSRFKRGNIKNLNTPNVYGIGFLGYGYMPNNKKQIYNTWKAMIQRCYCINTQKKQSTYKGCTVTIEWHNFQNFVKWYEKNYIENFELDKDILVKGNKEYSPNTCCFVPKEINVLFTKSNKIRGKYLIGVFKFKNSPRFSSQISIKGINYYLGTFDTEIEAFNVYKIAKENNIKLVANKFKNIITDKCFKALTNWQVEIND